MSEIKDKIMQVLQDGTDRFTAEIAKNLKISSTTASKYLSILEAEGKIVCYQKTPYKYWKVKEKGKKVKKNGE